MKTIDENAAGTVDAEIDNHIRQQKNSRRLFYRGSSRSDSWANITTSTKLKGSFDEDEEEESSHHDDQTDHDDEPATITAAPYADFLASRANLQVPPDGEEKNFLQQNLAKAEELFYKQEDQAKASAATAETADSAVTAVSAAGGQPAFKMQAFHPLHYDNVEHEWDKRPFTVDYLHTFFGTIRADKMDKFVKSKRSKIAKSGSWDPEGLVLNDLGRPFRCKLYFCVNDVQNLPHNFKVVYLNGTWLSKVYRGAYADFSDWVDDTIKYVKDKYGKRVSAYKNFFAYYPTTTETSSSADETLVVFFVKVSKKS